MSAGKALLPSRKERSVVKVENYTYLVSTVFIKTTRQTLEDRLLEIAKNKIIRTFAND
jgi:hypothetical protein